MMEVKAREDEVSRAVGDCPIATFYPQIAQSAQLEAEQARIQQEQTELQIAVSTHFCASLTVHLASVWSQH